MPTMLMANFKDWLSTTALPFLNAAVSSGQKLRTRWYEPVFDMSTTDRPFEQWTTYAKFGTMVETDENAPVTYDEAIQGFDKTLTPLQYALGYKLSFKAFSNDKLGPLRNLASGLGESDTESRNIITADILNNGNSSSFLGADGVSLYNTAHVREDGVTFRNKPTADADFSITSWKAALIDFRNFRDGRGKRLNLNVETIVVPPDNWHDVNEVLMSAERPDTSNRATNVYRSFFGGAGFNVVLCDYITDTDSWFLFAPKADHGLKFLEREAFNTQTETDFDTRTMKHAGWCQYAADWVGNGVGSYASFGA